MLPSDAIAAENIEGYQCSSLLPPDAMAAENTVVGQCSGLLPSGAIKAVPLGDGPPYEPEIEDDENVFGFPGGLTADTPPP